MSNPLLARQHYGDVQKEFRSDKSVEHLVFGKVTAALKSANVDAPLGMVELAKAITQNAKLWNLILVDIAHPDNKLPMPLKQNLIGLAEFVQAHSLKVLGGEATHQVLIDINKSIIAGLCGIQKPVISLDHEEAA